MTNLSEDGRAWESGRLNDHLRDWDISDARDRAIEARAEELLTKDGPDGYAPFGEQMARLFIDSFSLADVLADLVQDLADEKYAFVGSRLAGRMRDFARREALDDARIQIDKDTNEPTGAQLDAFEDRERGE